MAKTTRPAPQKPKEPTTIAVLGPPDPPNSDDDQDESSEPADTQPETPPTVTEVADAKEISRRRGNAQYKKAPSVGFISRLSQFEKTEWETQLLLYIYRLAPITDRLATGNQVKYIARFTEPIDEETILKDKLWGGSGKYRLTLNRKDPETGKSSCIDQAEIEIEHPEYPPVVPPGEWVDDPRNKRWSWARTNQPNGQPAQPAAAVPAGPTVNDLVDGMIKLKTLEPSKDTSMQTFVMERLASAEDRSNKLIDRIITPPPPAEEKKPSSDPIMTMVMDELRATRAELAEERKAFRDLLTKQNTPTSLPDPVAEIERYAKLGKTLRESFGPTEKQEEESRQSRMNGTQELIAELTKAITPVAEKALGLFTVMAAAKQPPPARPTRPPQTVDVAPTAEAPQPASAPTPQPEQPQPPPTLTQQEQMEQAQQQILNYVLGNATPTLQQYLEGPDPSESGESFAQWFCDTAFTLPGVPPPFNRLPGIDALKFAKQHGKDTIIEAYKKNPGLYQQIAPNSEAEEKFVRFLDAFLAYDPEQEEEEED